MTGTDKPTSSSTAGVIDAPPPSLTVGPKASQGSGGDPNTQGLRRTLTLPLLIFYGVGVTVGAGVFALIGEIVAVSGSQAPLAFAVAGAIAAVTGISYMLLIAEYPRAGGEAVYVSRGLGPKLGRVAGFGVIATGIISSAVVTLAFGGYVHSVIGVPKVATALALLCFVVVVASAGARQSVIAASVVTCIEVGTLVIVAVFGLPELFGSDFGEIVLEPSEAGLLRPIMAGAVVAFFAFIGFEDIANMAEETLDPRHAAPRAIAWTLGISMMIYLALAAIAVVIPERQLLAESDAPMAVLFGSVTPWSNRGADLVSTAAAIAMTNGVLVQVVMAARMLYGMTTEKLLPSRMASLGRVNGAGVPQTATLLVGVAIAVLAITTPLGVLARITSVMVLGVFALVNLALVRLGQRSTSVRLRRGRFVGVVGATLTVSLAAWEIASLF